MFNRVARCLTVAKKPLSFNRASRHPSPALLIRKNAPSLHKCICTGVSRRSETQEEGESKSSVETAAAKELQALLASDPEADKKYKILELEIDVMRQGGRSKVPDTFKPQHWLELLRLESRSARMKYLEFLFLTEKTRENRKKKKEQASAERAKLRESEEENPSKYGLHRATMFMRIYDTTMNQFYHSRLIQAMQFSEKLVIDCGYYDQMTPRECKECAKQLGLLFAENRRSRQPFDLHFCNVNKESILMKIFAKTIPTCYEEDFPLNIHETSYTEVFERKKLVYLTPHTNTEMSKYDHDLVYIVGGIVDKSNTEPLSLAKAKEEGLRMAKLPLDKYLLWGSGAGKRLPLNHMVRILSDIRITGDWKFALRHVPKRKLEKSLDQMDCTQGFERAKPDKPWDRLNPQVSVSAELRASERARSQNDFGYNQRSRPSRDTEGNTSLSFSFEARQKGIRNK